MSDKSCCTKDTNVQREVKRKFLSYRRLKTHKYSVSIGFPALIFSFKNISIDNFLMQFLLIENCEICLSNKVLLDADGHVCPYPNYSSKYSSSKLF